MSYGNANQFYLDPLANIAHAYQSIEVTTLVAKCLMNRVLLRWSAPLVLDGSFDGRTSGTVMSNNFPLLYGILAGAATTINRRRRSATPIRSSSC